MSQKNSNKLSPKLLYTTKLALVVLVFSFFGLFLYFFQPNWLKFNFKKDTPLEVVKVAEIASTSPACLNCVRRWLDGVMVKPELAELRPYAVMIDNFPTARPQSGLSSASLVYEAPAEGGITRYLAFFSPDQAPSEIGPIRSARNYFLNWAKDAGATYVHSGGSPEALESAKNLGKSDLNEFYKGSYFWRSDTRTAPHNVLISGDNLNNYRTENNESGLKSDSWKFKDGATTSIAVISRVDIKYPGSYSVYWKYQKETNQYERYLDNSLHLDFQGGKIIANNIVVHLTSFKVTDEKLRLEMSAALSGKALLCQDGNCQMGTWKKTNITSRVKYYNNNEEFIFNAGNTWIEVIDNLLYLEY